MKTSDRVGQKFGRLTFMERVSPPGTRNPRGRFLCECGTEANIQMSAVFHGNTISCGCRMKEYYDSGTVRTHGDWRSPEYKSWAMMKQRCGNPKDIGFANYGGRGIRVCARWNDYETFLADMGRKPSRDHSLDRIDVDGGYEPGNCRWATRLEQQANRRTARLLTYKGETMTMLQWSRRLGISWTSLAHRAKRGMTDGQIIETPRRNYPS